MREEPSLLEDVADLALPRRHEHPARCVGQHRAIDKDAAALRADQSGDRIDQRGLARSRTAEQRRQAGAALESGVEKEIAEAVLDGNAQHRTTRYSPWTRRVARSINASEANNASIEIAIETSVSRNAARSPPGTWISM